jgi:hypothetical protein
MKEIDMHYLLDCDVPLTGDGEAPLMIIHNTFRVGKNRLWKTGAALKHDVPTPIEIAFEPLREYQGSPVELLDIGIPIMSERLAKALMSSGVDNVSFYDAILTNTLSGEKYSYKAFNVLGLVAAADLQRSEWKSFDSIPLADVSFHSLLLDESKCRNLLMFRLAENANALVIHEIIKKNILAYGIDTLKFTLPEDWVQI